MKTVHTIADLRSALGTPGACAFVPTMGNLHEGHLALVRQAKRHGLPVVASIFVNRLQFAPHEDFDRYPRTLARDSELLQGAGCDLVFAPDEHELYPQPQSFKVVPDAALLSAAIFCMASAVSALSFALMDSWMLRALRSMLMTRASTLSPTFRWVPASSTRSREISEARR